MLIVNGGGAVSELRRPIRQLHQASARQYATVEDLIFGRATVRISEHGARLTGLSVVGGFVEVGDQVIVDYSSGVPPVVRPFTVKSEASTVAINPGESAIDKYVSMAGPLCFSVYGVTGGEIAVAQTPIQFSTVLFDNGKFFDFHDPTHITIPDDGFYMIEAHFGARAFVDQVSDFAMGFGDYFLLELMNDRTGVFAEAQCYPIDTLPPGEGVSVGNVSAHITPKPGDKISLLVTKHFLKPGQRMEISVQTGVYPRIMGYRTNRFHSTLVTASSVAGNEVPAAEPPSDIDISSNKGYLYFNNIDNSCVRAISHADDHSDMELTMDYKFDDVVSGGVFRVFLRASGVWYDWQTPTWGYELAIKNTGSWTLNRIQNGTRTQLATHTSGPTLYLQHMRFQTSGNYVRVRTWLEQDSEPSWQAEVNDTDGFTTSGTMQLGFFRLSGAHAMTIDNVNLHTP